MTEPHEIPIECAPGVDIRDEDQELLGRAQRFVAWLKDWSEENHCTHRWTTEQRAFAQTKATEFGLILHEDGTVTIRHDA